MLTKRLTADSAKNTVTNNLVDTFILLAGKTNNGLSSKDAESSKEFNVIAEELRARIRLGRVNGWGVHDYICALYKERASDFGHPESYLMKADLYLLTEIFKH